MAPKRPRETEVDIVEPKKPRTAFRVGPDNLPDGTWKRKVVKIKKDLIHKAKVKKAYAKIKAREPPVDRSFPNGPFEEARTSTVLLSQQSQELHPERQAMLDASISPHPGALQARSDRKRPRKPAYFEKETAYAEQKKAEAKARRLELERRDQERKQKTAERERLRKSMAKARIGGRNGQRKLGRESKVLLEKVRKVVGSE